MLGQTVSIIAHDVSKKTDRGSDEEREVSRLRDAYLNEPLTAPSTPCAALYVVMYVFSLFPALPIFADVTQSSPS